jgi:hypothetical protein
MEVRERKARCVVWCGRGLAAPARLDEALAGSGCSGVHVDNEFAAMAALCGGRKRGGATVLLAVEPRTLPSIGEMLEVLERYAPEAPLWAYESSPTERIRAVTAAERQSWRVKPQGWLEDGQSASLHGQPHAEPRITVTPQTLDSMTFEAKATRNVRIPHPSTNGPKLKLAGDGPGIPAPPSVPPLAAHPSKSDNPIGEPGSEPATTPARAPHLLTDEELAMLLAIDPPKGHN